LGWAGCRCSWAEPSAANDRDTPEAKPMDTSRPWAHNKGVRRTGCMLISGQLK
jgi:hypothetical protein